MLADILGSWGSIATILGTFIVVGGVLLNQVRRRKGTVNTRHAIDEVVIGVPEVKDERTGRVIQPERPGLIDRMDDMDVWRATVDERFKAQADTLQEILDNVKPNGGDSGTPADTTIRTERHVQQIAQRLNLDLK